MPAPANLVHQQSSGTGTGNLTLSAVNGKQSFATAFSTGVTTDVFDYFISNQSAAEWERGTGHMSDASTLVRDTVIESTNSNAAVSFSAGTKDVTNDMPAGKQARLDAANNFTAANQFGSIELGHASDTSLARVSSGRISVEGSNVIMASDVAAQSDQETSSSTTTFVSPGRQQYHPSAAKAWAVFPWTAGVPTLAASYNVSSLTDNAAGNVTINFSVAFSSANYGFVGMTDNTLGTNLSSSVSRVDINTQAAGSMQCYANQAGSGADNAFFSFVAFGDQ